MGRFSPAGGPRGITFSLEEFQSCLSLADFMDEPRSKPNLRWYVTRTQTKRERLAALQIRQRLGCDVFAPRIRYKKKTRQGMRIFSEALFPGYVFVKCDLSRDLRHLQAVQGVTGLVRFGHRYPFVPDALIEDLRVEVVGDDVEQPDPVIEVGHRVVVVDGPLKNLVAIVTEIIRPGERVRILLDFLGREAEVSISAGDVIPTDYSPTRAFKKSGNG